MEMKMFSVRKWFEYRGNNYIYRAVILAKDKDDALSKVDEKRDEVMYKGKPRRVLTYISEIASDVYTMKCR